MQNTTGLMLTFGYIALLVSGCSRGGRGLVERGYGSCTIAEPGSAPQYGSAAYTAHVTKTPDGFGVGSLGLTVTCSTTGLAADRIILMIPNLTRGHEIPLGEYVIRDPRDATLTPAQLTDRRMAWARVARGDEETALLFAARGGKVVITANHNGMLEGAYEAAIAAADESIQLPGARPEQRSNDGAAARYTIAPTVIAGAFVAPRTEADWRGR